MKRSVNGVLKPSSEVKNPNYNKHQVIISYQEKISTADVNQAISNITKLNNKDEGVKKSSVEVKKRGVKKAADSIETTKAANSQYAQQHNPYTSKETFKYRTITEKVAVASNGTFAFSVLEESKVGSAIQFVINGPDNKELFRKSYTYSELKTSIADVDKDKSAPLEIAVNPFEPLALVTTNGTAPYKVRGRVIQFENGKPLSQRILFIYTHVEGNQGYMPLLTVQTDAMGYFSFSMPGDRMKAVMAKIAGEADLELPFEMTQHATTKAQQLLVIEGALSEEDDHDDDHGDCGCSGGGGNNNLPLLPDAEDLAVSSCYSDDMGTCVDFTTPNRSLEEYTYFKLIRTTEPDIKKIPWQKPPRVNINSSIKEDAYEETPIVAPVGGEITPNQKFETALKNAQYHHNRQILPPNPVTTVAGFYTNTYYKAGDTDPSNGNVITWTNTSNHTSNNPINAEVNTLKNLLKDAFNKTVGDRKWWVYGVEPIVYMTQYFNTLKTNSDPTITDMTFLFEYLLGAVYPDTSSTSFVNNPYQIFGALLANDLKTQYNTAIGYVEFTNDYDFWKYCAQKYYESSGSMPPNPDLFKKFIEDTLIANPTTGTGNNGGGNSNVDLTAELNKWWLFTDAPTGDQETALNTLKTTLSNLFFRVYAKKISYESELYNFLRLTIDHYFADAGKLPKDPIELYDYIETSFAAGAKGRVILNSDHPVDWDETPTLFQNTSIAHGHILNFKQVWKADGYSMGDLLYSLPLAPGQKKQIAIFDWSRSETASRSEFLESEESMTAHLDRDRDVSEIINSSLGESVKGGSKTKTKSKSKVKSFSGGLGIGVGANIKMVKVGVSLGIGGGSGKQVSQGSSSSQAWQNSSRKLSAETMNQLRDKVMQGASAVRNQRSTVVQTVSQNERMSVTTEVIANHNHCHAMTMEYFEVLRHFAIEHQLTDVQECLFVPLQITPFSINKILRWQDELSNAIHVYDLLEGFEAVEKIKNKYQDGAQSENQILADEFIQDMAGEVTLGLAINRPDDDDTTAGQDVLPNKWLAIAPLLGPWRMNRIKAAFQAQEQAERERIFQEEILPEIFSNFIENIEFGYVDENNVKHPLSFDITVTNQQSAAFERRRNGKDYGGVRKGKWHRLRAAMKDYESGSPLTLRMRYMAKSGKVRRSDIKSFYVENPFALPDGSNVILMDGQIRYSSASLEGTLFNVVNFMDDISVGDSAEISTPLDSREQYNPVQDLYEKANGLIEHLNEHIEYYHKVIWYQMDMDRRFMLLDGFVAPNSGGKSVASVVENRLIAVVGNNLVMPVSRGLHLDPTYAQNQDEPIDLLAHYAPTTPLAPFRVSVPTRGVYAEAVMGACNSCEVIDESRHWRFTEVPTGDEPTAIMPINTDTRRADPGDLTAKDLPANIINFQNVPAAPNPTDLSGILAALTNPSIFKDITGLEGNQANAIKGLLANQKGALEAYKTSTAAALEYAKNAKELAMSANAIRNKDTVLSHIQDQKSKGNISDEQAKELTNRFLDNMVGGKIKEEPTEEKEPSVLDNDAIKEHIKKNPKAKVKANQGDDSIEVTPSDSDDSDDQDDDSNNNPDDGGDDDTNDNDDNPGGGEFSSFPLMSNPDLIPDNNNPVV